MVLNAEEDSINPKLLVMEDLQLKGEQKKVEIFVSGGQFSSPFYKFYLDKEGTSEIDKNNFKLDINTNYVFKRLNNATSHPFYSDIGYNKKALKILLSQEMEVITMELKAIKLLNYLLKNLQI